MNNDQQHGIPRFAAALGQGCPLVDGWWDSAKLTGMRVSKHVWGGLGGGESAGEMSAESSLEKGLGLFTWPSGWPPTAQVCKLHKAAMIGVGLEFPGSESSPPRRPRWALLLFKVTTRKQALLHMHTRLKTQEADWLRTWRRVYNTAPRRFSLSVSPSSKLEYPSKTDVSLLKPFQRKEQWKITSPVKMLTSFGIPDES